MTAPRRLRQIKMYCPEYETDATIRVQNDHPSGQPHLVTSYAKVPPHGHKEVAAAIPADWTDRDLTDLILLQRTAPPGRNWPAWEVPASDHASSTLFRFWRGEEAN
jgi:hypothetical protein